jgi:hypothetical protein
MRETKPPKSLRSAGAALLAAACLALLLAPLAGCKKGDSVAEAAEEAPVKPLLDTPDTPHTPPPVDDPNAPPPPPVKEGPIDIPDPGGGD